MKDFRQMTDMDYYKLNLSENPSLKNTGPLIERSPKIRRNIK